VIDYGAIYAKASRENAPGLGRDNFPAGIAAVVAAAKAEAREEMAAVAPNFGESINAVSEKRGTPESCGVTIWDDGYRMRCGYVIVNGLCVRHGRRAESQVQRNG